MSPLPHRHCFADLPWLDATVNAAMILTGMGSVELDERRAAGRCGRTDTPKPKSHRIAALEARCCDGIRFDVQRIGDRVLWEISGVRAVGFPSAYDAICSSARTSRPRSSTGTLGSGATW